MEMNEKMEVPAKEVLLKVSQPVVSCHLFLVGKVLVCKANEKKLLCSNFFHCSMIDFLGAFDKHRSNLSLKVHTTKIKANLAQTHFN